MNIPFFHDAAARKMAGIMTTLEKRHFSPIKNIELRAERQLGHY
jgi:hypothetical protein